MFIDDIPFKDALFAVIVRSPAAKGKLESVFCPALPSGFTFITAADIPGKNALFDGALPLLASTEVSYIGEPVALIVGDDQNKLEECARQCVIEIIEEEPCFSLDEAYEKESWFFRLERETGSAPKTGGGKIVEGRYETGIQEHWYSDPHGALVEIDTKNETFFVRTASECPLDVRAQTAAVLAVPEDKITVESAGLGIHFNGKMWYPSVIAALAALGAFVTRKNVKLQLTREEDYLFSPKRPYSIIHIESTLDAENQILETKVLIKIGLGAAGIFAEKTVEEACSAVINSYKLGKFTVAAAAVKNNTPPAGPFAGFGAAFGAFALERHIAKITGMLDEEGSDWRSLHFRSKVKNFFLRETPLENEYTDIINAAAQKAAFKRKWAVYELLRSKVEKDTEPLLPQRGAGISFFIMEDNDKKNEENQTKHNFCSAAACVVEIEIDRINYEIKIRGVWFYMYTGALPGKRKMELVVRRAIFAALGWASIEKLRFTAGKLLPASCAFYQLVPASAMPPLHIHFIEDDTKPASGESDFEKLPFAAVPAAYIQAVSQAANFHFQRIPITGQDIWRAGGEDAA